ncbi:hypothetical protein N7541_007212 [Penicillium brevicompactum]|uniref:Uncharacterized protein n=1 Tax=Penicillium brevicompactum TaxID=5074 RepID=A0A9W9QY68_PENBR|nr:hypothetical protein N7541_007212 [Penicillium brevicompactum]
MPNLKKLSPSTFDLASRQSRTFNSIEGCSVYILPVRHAVPVALSAPPYFISAPPDRHFYNMCAFQRCPPIAPHRS